MTAPLLIGAVYFAWVAYAIGSVFYVRGYRAGIATQQRIAALEAAGLPRGKRSPIWLTLFDFPTDSHAADGLIRAMDCYPPDEREPWEPQEGA